MEPEGSLPCSPKPTIGPSRQLEESNPQSQHDFSKIHFNIILSSTTRSFEWSPLSEAVRSVKSTTHLHLMPSVIPPRPPFILCWIKHRNNFTFLTQNRIASKTFGPFVEHEVKFGIHCCSGLKHEVLVRPSHYFLIIPAWTPDTLLPSSFFRTLSLFVCLG
jgi:hypothetical protein